MFLQEKPQLALALIAGALFLTNLGSTRLWDEDEPRNAACAREMLERGDWVVPTFNYELRAQKPALLYWLMMASCSIFGVNEFAARLPSALLAIGTTLVTFHLGRLLFNVRTGFLGGLMMASCLMFGVAGRAATPDAGLIFFTSLALLSFVASLIRRQAFVASEQGALGGSAVIGRLPASALRWRDLALAYASIALAVLAKGPVGVVLPMAIIGLFLMLVDPTQLAKSTSWLASLKALAGRFLPTAWSLRPFTLVAALAAIAGPWYLLVGLQTNGEWTRTFLASENLARFRGAMEGHSGPIVYYIAAILVGFFPWSILLPAAVWFAARDASRSGERCWRSLLLVVWAFVWVGFFSLSSTKLPSYVLPAYPALALMTAVFVDRWLAHSISLPASLMQSAWVSLTLVGAGLVVALPLAAGRYLPGAEGIGLVGLAPLAGGLAAIVCQWRGARRGATASLMATSIAFSLAMFAGAAVKVSERHNSASMIEIAQHANTAAPLATFAHPESSIVFYAGRRVERLADPADVERFFRQSPEGHLITNSDRWDELQKRLPTNIAVIARQPRFLKDGEVFLLGSSQAPRQTASASIQQRR